jgi:dCMP deaminase
VGAAIFDRDRRIVAKGYNGFPQGCPENEELWQRENKGDWVVHAELNAVANAARTGASTKDGVIFVTIPPCLDCAKAIAAAGIRAVYYPQAKADEWAARSPHWAESIEKALNFLRTNNIGVIGL